MLQVQSENPMVVRGSVWTTHFKFGLMVVKWSIPSGLPGSRITRTISQSARKWRLMAETGTTQFAQWNDLLFVRKKIRWGSEFLRYLPVKPRLPRPPPASSIKAAYFNIYHLGLIFRKSRFSLVRRLLEWELIFKPIDHSFVALKLFRISFNWTWLCVAARFLFSD